MRPPRDPAVPERTGILVIRVWVEHDDADPPGDHPGGPPDPPDPPGDHPGGPPDPPGRLRARLTQAGDLGETATTLAVATGVPGIRNAVEAWLTEFLEPGGR
jgi:hypothetical protein